MIIKFVIVICWSAFILLILAGAIYNFLMTRIVARLKKSLVIFIVGVIFIWFIGKCIPESYWNLFTYRTMWIQLIGTSILVLSTVLAVWARITLGTMWTGDASIKENHRLYTKGPYSITRHPIYTGILGMVLGTVLINGFGLGVFLYFFGVLILLNFKIYDEERLLIETFGEEYHNYKRYVPRIIPCLNLLKKHVDDNK